MKTKFWTLLLLPSMLMAVGEVRLLAQDAVFLHKHGEISAFDLPNVKISTVKMGEMLLESGGVAFRETVDSATFYNNGQDTSLKGWWGDLKDGWSKAYYQSHKYQVPNVEFFCEGGHCLKVLCFILETDSMVADSLGTPNQAGKKWRYVKNTLSGKGPFRFTISDDSVSYRIDVNDKRYSPYICADISRMLSQTKADDARCVLNYWYLPSACTTFPDEPVFGKYEHGRYKLNLSGTMRIAITFDNPSPTGFVTSDTIRISYPNSESAQNDYKMLSQAQSEGFFVNIYGQEIIIVEIFKAVPKEEALLWLMKFDMDMYKPAFLDEQ